MPKIYLPWDRMLGLSSLIGWKITAANEMHKQYRIVKCFLVRAQDSKFVLIDARRICFPQILASLCRELSS